MGTGMGEWEWVMGMGEWDWENGNENGRMEMVGASFWLLMARRWIWVGLEDAGLRALVAGWVLLLPGVGLEDDGLRALVTGWVLLLPGVGLWKRRPLGHELGLGLSLAFCFCLGLLFLFGAGTVSIWGGPWSAVSCLCLSASRSCLFFRTLSLCRLSLTAFPGWWRPFRGLRLPGSCGDVTQLRGDDHICVCLPGQRWCWGLSVVFWPRCFCCLRYPPRRDACRLPCMIRDLGPQETFSLRPLTIKRPCNRNLLLLLLRVLRWYHVVNG